VKCVSFELCELVFCLNYLHIWSCSTLLTKAVTLSALPDLSRRRHVLLNGDHDEVGDDDFDDDDVGNDDGEDQMQ